MPKTSADEPFEVFSASGERLGIEPRGTVHRLGLWHRSAHVFLFDAEQRMLLQQRSADKDLYPGVWDYAVGEHLQPGESYLQGAQRGLTEELGLTVPQLQALGPPTPAEFVSPDGAQIDREFQQAYQAQLSEPADAVALRPDPDEIAAIAWLTKAELGARITADASAFTPWFVRDVQRFALLD